MKALKFNFSHPFKGNACLINGSKRRKLAVDSQNLNDFEIPVEDCSDGKWQIFLDWEFDGRPFVYQGEFFVKRNRVFEV